MIGMLLRMTTHTTNSAAESTTRPVERTVTIVLILSAVAGFAWVGSMVFSALRG